jgi:hypothetical protein
MVKEKPAFPVNRVSDFPHNISLECETATESLTLWQLIIDKPWMGPHSRSMDQDRIFSISSMEGSEAFIHLYLEPL